MTREDRRYIAQTAALLAARAVRRDMPQGSHIAADDALGLHRIATKLHRWAERECNEDLTCPVCHGEGRTSHPGDDDSPLREAVCRACAGHGTTLGRRIERQRKLGQEVATKYGLRVYWQTDPRGCPLYLIPEEAGPQAEDDSYYNMRGAAVCHLG